MVQKNSWYFSGRIIRVYNPSRKQFYMSQETLNISHEVVKILEESMWEFVNDLRMKKVSLNKIKNIDAKTEKLTCMSTQILNHYTTTDLIAKLKDNQENDQQREPSSYGWMRRPANHSPKSNSEVGKHWQKQPFQCPRYYQRHTTTWKCLCL